jgi:hypothetical protein
MIAFEDAPPGWDQVTWSARPNRCSECGNLFEIGWRQAKGKREFKCDDCIIGAMPKSPMEEYKQKKDLVRQVRREAPASGSRRRRKNG